ncbi:MAG: lysine--tRNA ligase, partial [Anaerolineae bacterium]|nr:lysine--tRNA ligase [Anaerolineae bacterium]
FTAEQVVGSKLIEYQGQSIDLGKAWPRLELREALKQWAEIDIAAFPDAASLAEEMRGMDMKPDPNAARGKLVDTLIGTFVEPKLVQPTFLLNYPRDISPLAKNVEGDENTVERFEGFVAGFELCNAFTELNDPIEQERRFVEMGRAYNPDEEEYHPIDEDYLRAMRYGMPPNGGFGMGLDRLVMLFTDKPNIREVILFPHLRQRGDE